MRKHNEATATNKEHNDVKCKRNFERHFINQFFVEIMSSGFPGKGDLTTIRLTSKPPHHFRAHFQVILG